MRSRTTRSIVVQSASPTSASFAARRASTSARRWSWIASREPSSQSSSSLVPSASRPDRPDRQRRGPPCSSPRAARRSRTGSTRASTSSSRKPMDRLAQVLVVEDLVALGVDRLALLVDHVVELDDALADVEVEALDPGLGALDRLADDARLDGHVVLEAHPLHQPGDPIRREPLHQVVVERQVEARRARVALAPGPAAELVVDPPAVVALGADDVQAAGRHDHARGPRRRSPGPRRGPSRTSPGRPRPGSGRAGGAGPRPSLPGSPPSLMSVPRPAMLVAIVTAPLRPAWAMIPDSFSWNLALRTSCLIPRRLSISPRISDFSTRHRADQDRPAGLGHLADLVDQGVELALLVAEDEVRLVVADHRRGGSGWRPLRGCRSCGTPRPRSSPYRSSRPACRTAGSSSGR